MKGTDYEQVVRAVLLKKLNIAPEELKSVREHGATLPGGPELKHQIDLFHIDSTEIADYITIIECKYRTSELVDQEELAKLAFVKSSIKASKAILVSNLGFTAGARSLATSERIALLKIEPDEKLSADVATVTERPRTDSLLNEILHKIESRPTCCSTTVVCRLMPDPNDRGLDIVDKLLSDPNVRNEVEKLVRDPEVRRRASDLLRDNPDLERRARDILGGRGGGLF